MRRASFRLRTLLLLVIPLVALALTAGAAMERRRELLRQADQLGRFSEAYEVMASMEHVDWSVPWDSEPPEEIAIAEHIQRHFEDKAYLRRQAAFYHAKQRKYLHRAQYPFLPLWCDPPPR